MKKINLIIVLVLFSTLFMNSCKEESVTEPQHEHYETYGINIYHSDSLYLKVFNAVIDTNYHQSFALTMNSQPEEFKLMFLDENGKELAYPTDSNKVLGWLIADTTIVNATISSDSRWNFVLEAKKPGNTSIEIRLNHIDHPDFKTPLIPIMIK